MPKTIEREKYADDDVVQLDRHDIAKVARRVSLAAVVAIGAGVGINNLLDQRDDRLASEAFADLQAAGEARDGAQENYARTVNAECSRFIDDVYQSRVIDDGSVDDLSDTIFSVYVDGYENEGTRVCGGLEEAETVFATYEGLHTAETEFAEANEAFDLTHSSSADGAVGLAAGAVAGIASYALIDRMRSQHS